VCCVFLLPFLFIYFLFNLLVVWFLHLFQSYIFSPFFCVLYYTILFFSPHVSSFLFCGTFISLFRPIHSYLCLCFFHSSLIWFVSIFVSLSAYFLAVFFGPFFISLHWLEQMLFPVCERGKALKFHCFALVTTFRNSPRPLDF